MKLIDMWYDKMVNSISKIRGKSNDKEYKLKLQEFLRQKYGNEMSDDIQLLMRNLYTDEYFSTPANDILDVVKTNKLIINSNGTFTYRHEVKVASTASELTTLGKRRRIVKNEALAQDALGNYGEGAKIMSESDKIKTIMNSFYGIMIQFGSYLNSPDTASAITGNAREWISDAMMSLEKSIGSNMMFTSFDELLMYIVDVSDTSSEEYLSYVTYIPTKDDITDRVNQLLDRLLPFDKAKAVANPVMMDSLHSLVENLTENQQIHLYYRNNLLVFLDKNPKVYDLIDFVMRSDKVFVGTDPKNTETFPEEFQPKMDLLFNILMSIVLDQHGTYDRANKYHDRKREVVLLSDTDSVMPWLGRYVQFILSRRPEIAEDDFMDNFDILFNILNPMVYVVTKLTNVKVWNMAKAMNIEEKYWYNFDMKNEFIFISVAIYREAKKNYSTRTINREGNRVDKIVNTGGNLNKTSQHPEVLSMILDIIKNDIHYARKHNMTEIWRKMEAIKTHIKNKLYVEKDIEYGVAIRYNGYSLSKNWLRTVNARAGTIFNILYPDHNISASGGRCYLFKTSIRTENDLMKISNVEEREHIRKLIYHNPSKEFCELANYGCEYIAVPADREMIELPQWIIDNMDVNKIVESHLGPLVKLIPSIGIYSNRLGSTVIRHSPLLSVF